MIDGLASLIVAERNWLPVSMGLAMLAVGVLLYRHSGAGLLTRRRVLAAMNVFFGITIGVMACGHVLAVTTKLGLGTLHGSVWVLYAIGAAIGVPSWWLAVHSWRSLASNDDRGRPALALNAWLSATLLALGIVNLPLAVPGFLNISYHLHSRRSVGWAIIALAAIVHGGLFVGGLIFLASGQSFEQFQGIQ